MPELILGYDKLTRNGCTASPLASPGKVGTLAAAREEAHPVVDSSALLARYPPDDHSASAPR